MIVYTFRNFAGHIHRKPHMWAAFQITITKDFKILTVYYITSHRMYLGL